MDKVMLIRWSEIGVEPPVRFYRAAMSGKKINGFERLEGAFSAQKKILLQKHADKKSIFDIRPAFELGLASEIAYRSLAIAWAKERFHDKGFRLVFKTYTEDHFEVHHG
jgi:hypothetical protein